MAKLVWDQTGEHLYETGVDHGVLYPFDANTRDYGTGVAWNGLTQVSETPSGAESNPIYADNIKYLDIRSAEEFGATIEAYTYPDEWAECDGSKEITSGVTIGQQPRKSFAMSYRTKVGNDTVGSDFGYKLHIIYGGTASPSERSYQTINDSPEAITFSWEVTTTPVDAGEGNQKTANLVIDSTKFVTEADKAKLKEVEDALYGTDETEPRLLMPEDIVDIMEGESTSTDPTPTPTPTPTTTYKTQEELQLMTHEELVAYAESLEMTSEEIAEYATDEELIVAILEKQEALSA